MKTIILRSIISMFCLNSYSQTTEEYFNRGFSKANLKDYKVAIADYTKAIELEPNDAAAYYNRGLTKIFLNQKDIVV